jgi:hypothetical protein
MLCSHFRFALRLFRTLTVHPVECPGSRSPHLRVVMFLQLVPGGLQVANPPHHLLVLSAFLAQNLLVLLTRDTATHLERSDFALQKVPVLLVLLLSLHSGSLGAIKRPVRAISRKP